MSYPGVQNRRLLDVVLPMSHGSTAFEIYGERLDVFGKGRSVTAVKQDYDIYQQLMLGVRAFDIPVAFNRDTHCLYGVSGLLTLALVRVLSDIREFLLEYTKEIVVIDLRKGELSQSDRSGTLQPIIMEEFRAIQGSVGLPGQMVHDVVTRVLGDYLADYGKISQLKTPPNDAESPRLRDLVDVGARVFYFWEGQQVLCTTRAECRRTPGWTPPRPDSPFAFGAPMVLGRRAQESRRTALEPLCINPSEPHTSTNKGVKLLTLLKNFSAATQRVTMQKTPSCYPADTELPMNHIAPLFHRLDAWLAKTPEEIALIRDTFSTNDQVPAFGEVMTVRSAAERLNYLLLLWYFVRGNQDMYSRMNLIAMDFVHPAIVHRIISAMQGDPDCGFLVYCNPTATCFAANLNGVDSTCLDTLDTEYALQDHEMQFWLPLRYRWYLFWIFWFLVKAFLFVACFAAGSASEGTKYVAEQAPPADPAADPHDDPQPADDGAMSG